MALVFVAHLWTAGNLDLFRKSLDGGAALHRIHARQIPVRSIADLSPYLPSPQNLISKKSYRERAFVRDGDMGTPSLHNDLTRCIGVHGSVRGQEVMQAYHATQISAQNSSLTDGER